MASAASDISLIATFGELTLAPLGGLGGGSKPKRTSSEDPTGTCAAAGAAGSAGAAPAATNSDEPHELKACGVSADEMIPLMETPEKLLLIDARPYSDYVVGHISGSLSVRLSSLMTRRLVRGKLKLFDLIVNEQKDQFKALYDQQDCCIIVYDSKTPDDGIGVYSSKNPLHVILRALDAESREGCRFLLGGFDSFKAALPDKVFVPEVRVFFGVAFDLARRVWVG
jgi:rhodanese-related sulfurtransferase